MREMCNESQWALLLGTDLAVQKPATDGRALTRKALAAWLRHAPELHDPPSHNADMLAIPGRDDAWLRRRLDGRALLASRLADLERQGIRVTTVFESDYPRRLRVVLGAEAPPVLFYAGNLELASAARVAGFVGSRNASPESLDVTNRLAISCADQRVTVCSGGARGVDKESEDAVLAAGGRMLMCPAEGLSHVVRKRRFRYPMAEGRMLCVSMMDPGAGWQVGHAMERNVLIYALSTLVCVMHAEGPKGGTWAGATEALELGATVVASWTGAGSGPGNQELLERGAYGFTSETIGAVIRELRQRNPPASTNEPKLAPSAQSKLFGIW